MPIVTQFDPPCASKNDWNDEETRRRIAALAGFNEGYSLQVGNIFLKLVYLPLSDRDLLNFHNIFPLKPVTGGAAAVHIWKDYYHILR